MRILIALLLVLTSLEVRAQSGVSTNEGKVPDSFFNKFGMTYFTFYDGQSLEDPGFFNGRVGKNERGRPINGNDGYAAFNNISITYKLTERINLDQQTRLEYVHNSEREWRFQGMRIGISGRLMSGKNWSLKGAFNTDIPELNGYTERSRTTIFNPGLFAGLFYQISPRWSFYSILTPRYYFYRDDDAVEKQWAVAGRDPGQKRRFELRGSPTINYAFNDKVGMRAGLDVQIMNLMRDRETEFTRFPTTAITAGPTFAIHKSFNIYVFARTFPFDGLKARKETLSLGAWINGVIF
jgi:hypothetical protein